MYKKIILDNGLRMVTEKLSNVRSVSIGVWVGTGSRNENRKNNGISHFIEHMMFKGTKNRTAKQIARSIDDIGGQINAFTGKESTCFYTRTLDEHLEIAMEILSDMFFNSKFDVNDMETEKKVIMEEIGMYEDSPEELVHDVLSETVWREHPLGFPILGTQKCIGIFNKKIINRYMRGNYLPENCVISVAGSFDEQKLVQLANKYFCEWKTINKSVSKIDDVNFVSGASIKNKKIEQVHVCIAFNGIEHGNDKLYTLLAINNILGGGMSSNLFQKIREEKGLVYSVYSFPSSYRNAGLFNVYACMNPEHFKEVIGLICDEIKNLIDKGISDNEIEKSKEQLKGSYILGLESTSSRMNSIGKSEVLLGYVRTPNEILERINAVTAVNSEKLVREIFNKKDVSISVVGNIDTDTDLMSMIKI